MNQTLKKLTPRLLALSALLVLNSALVGLVLGSLSASFVALIGVLAVFALSLIWQENSLLLGSGTLVELSTTQKEQLKSLDLLFRNGTPHAAGPFPLLYIKPDPLPQSHYYRSWLSPGLVVIHQGLFSVHTDTQWEAWVKDQIGYSRSGLQVLRSWALLVVSLLARFERFLVAEPRSVRGVWVHITLMPVRSFLIWVGDLA